MGLPVSGDEEPRAGSETSSGVGGACGIKFAAVILTPLKSQRKRKRGTEVIETRKDCQTHEAALSALVNSCC